MRWSNCFSYGENNEIDFDEHPLFQLVGKNGHGKTSIGLILEEGTFNKNSKGIKKADILNRHSGGKFYTIEVNFQKDGKNYKIETKRGTTQTVHLYCEGVDISSHTATGTYKQIEELMGMDHKTFVQIVIQSSSSSLEFLTATDSTRKKFLIDLLNLNKYVELGETFKVAVKGVETVCTALNAKISSAESWLTKNAKADLSTKSIVDVPEQPKDMMQQVAGIRSNIANIASINKRITQNNQYKKLLEALKVEPVGNKPGDYSQKLSAKISFEAGAKRATEFIQKMSKLGGQCPTCLQDIDKAKVSEIVASSNTEVDECKHNIAQLTTEITNLQNAEREWKRKAKILEEYEQYHSLYDPSIDTMLMDQDALEQEIAQLNKNITNIQASIDKAVKANAEATAHNARVEVIKQQISEFESEIGSLRTELAEASKKLGHLQVLVKTFSPSGLVAYKIECLVKDLEELSNGYLAEMSSGRFQLSFKISGSDKLNVVITDNGHDIDILALSSGERARVNVATLLGIRRMLQVLSNNRINLLFLDETLENLDIEGKDRLVEVLLKEDELNTVLVSHSFTHPLIERIGIIKEHNISRIE